MKNLLLLITMSALLSCSKSSDPAPDNKPLDPTGNKYRRQTWSIGGQSDWRYDVLEFKANGVVIRDTRFHNDKTAYSDLTETLKWEKTPTGVNVWIFSNLKPYAGTVTANSITLDMGGSERWVYDKY